MSISKSDMKNKVIQEIEKSKDKIIAFARYSRKCRNWLQRS